MTKTRYEMTLIWEDYSYHFSFWSYATIEDGEHNEYLDEIMCDWLYDNGFDEHNDLPIDYSVDTYENWCFMQNILEQEEMRNAAEDSEWGCFPY